MYGAILGDIIGSVYEFDRGNKTKEFPLFSRRSEFTDDSVMTIAVAEALMETGAISEKSQRGKHTTRHSELFALDEEGTMIFDTPGFTSFDILTADAEELQFLYPEIGAFAGQCRYDNCRHLAEPECAVKQALEEGRISASRYRSYKEQMEELLK